MKRVCVLFHKDHKPYRKNTYSWVKEKEAEFLIREGYGKEYDPVAKKVIGVPVTMKNTKKEIEAYLDEQGIEISETATKAELLELV